MGAKFSTSSKKRQARQSSSQRQNQFQTNSGSSDGSVMRFGRKFHDVSSSAYWFPNDDEEIDRLVGQHFALKTLFRGNVVEKCRESVPLEQGALVLDVGCGPGTWLMDMATEYPCSNFIGVDMCDIFPTNIRPSNVSFQVANVLERLPFPDNTFDFVNMRLFIIALRKEQWPTVIKELYRVLKPGGYLQSVECGMLERGNDFIVWAGQVFKDTIFSRGQEPHVASQLPTLQQNAGFIIEHYETKDIYLGKPSEDTIDGRAQPYFCSLLFQM
ncbi:S-adenosyl-L-methionine-dependent methyltransferase [Radiomyces spectabilis]|uniref:S-adenosyl-L-methionine-dependent methyltransferase n=1 Tax=Radiomyces spectabilis TaxID=64574 RepID=UPI00221E8602|nr:S-adenosyl-L-methionine-dependent methyltransferase [Radiomyces spectabilis]KAI8376460.1 S-adenosyl-L-methionine-dependent methyltransferase [Radiomyces spectabilis]